MVAFETDPTLSPGAAVKNPAAPVSDASKAWMGDVRADVRARLFADPDATEHPDGSARSPSSGPPTRIGRYVVIKRIGAGGMGVVYAAYDDKLDRKVAVKLLRPGYGPVSENARRRLLREAQAIARLSHRCVVQVYEVGTHEDEVFVAMEYVEGSTLKQWQPSRDWRDILARYLDAGRGLCAAHGAGIVHRDFKADNVLVRASDLAVRVVDFGLARTDGHGPPANTEAETPAREDDPSLTRTGLVMGTPAYMAPEQHLAVATDTRTDQFSFCASLFEALYGYRAFAGERLDELRANVLAGKVEPAPRYTAVPPHVHKVLARGLSVDPDDRHPTMESLLALLELPKPSRPWQRITAAFGVTAVVVMGGIAWSGSDTTSLSPEGMRVRAEFEAALESDAESELARYNARSVPERWNDLVLSYASSTPHATDRLAALRHLGTTTDHWLPRANAAALDALRAGPMFALHPTTRPLSAIRFSATTDEFCARTNEGALLRWSSPTAERHEALDLPSPAIDMAYAADGALLVVLAGGRLATLSPGETQPRVRQVYDGELARIATDGRQRTAFGAEDGSVLVEGEHATTLHEHDAPVVALAFHPTADTLATGDRSGRVNLWFLARDTHRSMGVDRAIQDLTWMAGAETLVAETSGGPLAWDGVRGTPTNAPISPDARGFAASQSGLPFAEHGPDGLVAVFADEHRLVLDGGTDIGAPTMSPDGQWLAATHDTGLAVWRTGPDAGGVHPLGERRHVVDTSDALLGVHARRDTLFAFDTRGEVFARHAGRFESVAALNLDVRAMTPGPDGRRVALQVGDEGRPFVVDLDAPASARPLGVLSGGTPGTMQWSPDGSAVAKLDCETDSDGCRVSLHPLDGRDASGVDPLPRGTAMVDVAPLGDAVALVHARHVSLWRPASGEVKRFAPPEGTTPLGLAFTPEGVLRIAWFNPGSGAAMLRVDQVDQGADPRSVFEEDGLRRLHATVDRRALVLETTGGRTLLWRLATDAFVPLPADLVSGRAPELQLSPKGTRLWVADSGSRNVTVFALDEGVRRVLPRPSGTFAWLREGWADLGGPREVRDWDSAVPRNAEAFSRWLRGRTLVEIPVSSVQKGVPSADERL